MKAPSVDKSLFGPSVTPPAILLRSMTCAELTSAWNWSNLQRPFFRLYMNHHNGAYIRHQDERYPIKPGEAMLVPAWFPFAAHCRGQVEHLSVHFDLDNAMAMPPVGIRPFAVGISSDVQTRLSDVSGRLRARQSHAGDSLQVIGCIADLLALAYEREACWRQLIDETPVHDAGLIQKALVFAERVQASRDSVADLATHLEISASHLRRVLKAQLGITPHELLNRFRLRHACLQLRIDSADLATIACSCGFEDRHYFSRWFRKHMAVTPSDYRAGIHSYRG